MKQRLWYLVVIAGVIFAILCAGCSSKSSDTQGPGAVPSGAAVTAAATAAPVAAATTQVCPDANEKGVWIGTWDAQAMSAAGNHDIQRISFTNDGTDNWWGGSNSGESKITVILSQKCQDVAGTFSVTNQEPVVSGTITGAIERNRLSGTWKSASEFNGDTGGTFSVVMAADNQTWTGDLFTNKDIAIQQCAGGSCPPNWAGKRG